MIYSRTFLNITNMQRELNLQGDLASAGKEILRLRDLVKDFERRVKGVHRSLI